MLKIVQMSLIWFAIATFLFVFAGYFEKQSINLNCFASAALLTTMSVILNMKVVAQIICFISIVIILLIIKCVIEKIPFYHLDDLIGQYGEVIDDSEQPIAQIGKRKYKVESHLTLSKHDVIKVLKVSRTKLIVRRIRKRD